MKPPSGDQGEGIRFEVYPDYSGRFRWRLRTRELLIIADSAQSYASSEGAAMAAWETKALARQAEIADVQKIY